MIDNTLSGGAPTSLSRSSSFWHIDLGLRGNGPRRPNAHFSGRVCALSILAACLVALAPPARAQQQKSKVPIVGKLGSNSDHEAFSGKVASVDLTEKILNVNARQGRETEIFPLRKDTRIQGVNGKKLKLQALTPGTSVLIYYRDKGSGREIKNIIVLEGAKDHGKSNVTPPSS